MEGRNYMSGRDGRKELCEWAGWKECLKMFKILCVCVCVHNFIVFCCCFAVADCYYQAILDW